METDMAQRVPFPADVCPEPDARSYRTLAEAFPCGPREAVAVQRFEPPKVWRWVLLAIAMPASAFTLKHWLAWAQLCPK